MKLSKFLIDRINLDDVNPKISEIAQACYLPETSSIDAREEEKAEIKSTLINHKNDILELLIDVENYKIKFTRMLESIEELL